MNSRDRVRDGGASLVLVLVLLMFTGLVVAAVMKLARTSLDSSLTTTEQARLALDVDGSLEMAVNDIRLGTYDNEPGQPCPTLGLTGPNSGVPLQVVCQPVPGTGEAGHVAITAANRAPAALLSLAEPGESGVNQIGSAVLRVSGPVTSNSTVAATPGALTVTNGRVTARGACTGTITSEPAPACDTGTPVADPAVADPAKYAQPDTGVTYRPVPACPKKSGETIKFEPGFYDDAVALTNLMATCTGSTFWFQSDPGGGVGNYYFDFRNGESPGQPSAQSGEPIWRINDPAVRVVAGTPSGWNPDAATRQEPVIPGSCVAPNESATNGGVRFLFGGRSRIEIGAGLVEICGQYHTDRPPIAVQGATTGLSANPSGPLPVWPTGFGTTGCKGNPVAFTSPGNAAYLDGIDASAVVPRNRTACLGLTGYGQQVLPPGSTLVNATLIVAHWETGTVPASITVNLTPNPGRAGAAEIGAVTVNPNMAPATRRDPFDLTSQLASESQVHGLNGFAIRYSPATSNVQGASTTAYLDSVQLSLTWIPPGVRPLGTPLTTYATTGTHTRSIRYQTAASSSATDSYQAAGGEMGPGNCLSTTPYPDGGSCAFLKSTNSDGVLYVQGTTYVPTVPVDVASTGLGRPLFDWGLVARTIRLNLTGAPGYEGPLVRGPTGSSALAVRFQAYECPTGKDCSAEPAPGGNWRPAGGALATYEGLIGSRSVVVDDWELLY